MFTYPMGNFLQGGGVPDLHSVGLDGSSSLYMADTAALSPAVKFTVEQWVRLTAWPSVDDYVVCKDTAGQRTFGLFCNKQITTERIIFNASDTGATTTNQARIHVNGLWTTNVWFHLAVTFDGSLGATWALTTKFFLNGVEKAIDVQSSGPPATLYDGTAPLEWGSYNAGSNFFLGDLCEMRFWPNVVRTPAEILANYNAVINSPYTDLEAYIHPETSLVDVAGGNTVLTRGTPVIGTDVPFTP